MGAGDQFISVDVTGVTERAKGEKNRKGWSGVCHVSEVE